MTDRELMQMARTALELRCTDADGNEVDLVTPAIKALRDRLEQPEPVHASDISQERVDETAKRGHEFFCPRCGHCCREWVGLTEHMKLKLADKFHISMDAVEAIEAKLKEKNT